MPRLLDHSPFPRTPSEIVFRGERIRVRADQIILWVTLTRRREELPPPSAVPFPVILDTGHSHSFSIREHHVRTWAGLRPELLPLRGAVRDRGQRLVLRGATLWVHPNRRGSRDRLADVPPYSLGAQAGIAVYPGDFPRLPILGLRTIAENELVLKIDGRRREATLRAAPRWWPFAWP